MNTIVTTQMTIMMSREYGGLNRLLGLVRQRCFEVESLHVHPENETTFRIQLVVFSERSIHHLLKKVNQMVEVQMVSARTMTPLVDCMDAPVIANTSLNGSLAAAAATAAAPVTLK